VTEKKDNDTDIETSAGRAPACKLPKKWQNSTVQRHFATGVWMECSRASGRRAAKKKRESQSEL